MKPVVAVLLVAVCFVSPASADDCGVVGAVMGAINAGMSNNNPGDSGYSGGSDE